MAFLEAQRARLAAGELDPGAILDVSGSAWEDDPATLTAWALAARVLLNLDETIGGVAGDDNRRGDRVELVHGVH